MYCNTNVKLATPAYKNILEAIGNTPLVKLNKFPQKHGLKCQVYAKCEFTNPGGSIKDRIAYSMMTHAEKEGKAHKGTRFVEPTSGNTGIGLAMTAVVKNLDEVQTQTLKRVSCAVGGQRPKNAVTRPQLATEEGKVSQLLDYLQALIDNVK